MSEAVREAISALASSVEGITCHPYYVQAFHTGNAMVRLERIEYPDRLGGICHWNVVLFIPQDQGQAERYIDATVPLIRAAVASELVVTSVQPQRLEIKDVGVLPCVFINGHREQE